MCGYHGAGRERQETQTPHCGEPTSTMAGRVIRLYQIMLEVVTHLACNSCYSSPQTQPGSRSRQYTQNVYFWYPSLPTQMLIHFEYINSSFPQWHTLQSLVYAVQDIVKHCLSKIYFLLLLFTGVVVTKIHNPISLYFHKWLEQTPRLPEQNRTFSKVVWVTSITTP